MVDGTFVDTLHKSQAKVSHVILSQIKIEVRGLQGLLIAASDIAEVSSREKKGEGVSGAEMWD